MNILHVFRAPVGGLFRHVVDLVREIPEAMKPRKIVIGSNSNTRQIDAQAA